MCGIVGYIGKRDATPVLVEGLHRLEYRGYDSAGIAVLHRGRLQVTKTAGRAQDLRDRLDAKQSKATIGIGHTRWATHGEPNDVNAHPHTDAQHRIAVVHNGIIENAEALRAQLTAARGRCSSPPTWPRSSATRVRSSTWKTARSRRSRRPTTGRGR